MKQSKYTISEQNYKSKPQV